MSETARSGGHYASIKRTVPFEPATGPANEMKILALDEATFCRAFSSFNWPSVMFTSWLERILSGSLLGFRTRSVRAWPWERASSQKARPTAPVRC